MIYSKKANNTLFQSFVAVGSRIAQFLLNTDELIVFGHAVANLLGQFYPVVPVVLVESVLDRVDRILGDELFQIGNLLVG